MVMIPRDYLEKVECVGRDNESAEGDSPRFALEPYPQVLVFGK